MPRRRDDIEICMEILDLLQDRPGQVTISEIISFSRIKHSKAKQLLETMEKSGWISQSNYSYIDDQRYKNFFYIQEEGQKNIKFYKENMKVLISFLEPESKQDGNN